MIQQVLEVKPVIRNILKVDQHFRAVFLSLMNGATERKHGHGGADDDHQVAAPVRGQWGRSLISSVEEGLVADLVPALVERLRHLVAEEYNIRLDWALAGLTQLLFLLYHVLPVGTVHVLAIRVLFINSFRPLIVAVAVVNLLPINMVI